MFTVSLSDLITVKPSRSLIISIESSTGAEKYIFTVVFIKKCLNLHIGII